MIKELHSLFFTLGIPVVAESRRLSTSVTGNDRSVTGAF